MYPFAWLVGWLGGGGTRQIVFRFILPLTPANNQQGQQYGLHHGSPAIDGSPAAMMILWWAPTRPWRWGWKRDMEAAYIYTNKWMYHRHHHHHLIAAGPARWCPKSNQALYPCSPHSASVYLYLYCNQLIDDALINTPGGDGSQLSTVALICTDGRIRQSIGSSIAIVGEPCRGERERERV